MSSIQILCCDKFEVVSLSSWFKNKCVTPDSKPWVSSCLLHDSVRVLAVGVFIQ